MREFNPDEKQIIKDALNKSLEKNYEYLLDEIKNIANACNDFASMNHDEKSEILYSLSLKMDIALKNINRLRSILDDFNHH